jgi:ankyrin repeat protein
MVIVVTLGVAELVAIALTLACGECLCGPIRSGDLDRLRRALELGVPPNCMGISGEPVSWAAMLGRSDMVGLLLDHGADPGPAVTAATIRRQVGVLRLLDTRGVDLTVSSGGGAAAPLAIARKYRYSEVVAFLEEVARRRGKTGPSTTGAGSL